MCKLLSDRNFVETINERKSPKVIIFTADWSGNAVILETIMEKVIAKFETSVEFYKTDIDLNPATRKFFNITTVPTLVFLEDGEIRNMQRGLLPKKKIIEKINDTFKSIAA